MIDLSDRQLHVLQRLAAGEDVPEIAEALFLSPHTVKTYKAKLFAKLDARNTAHAVALAYQRGILAGPPALAEAAALIAGMPDGYRIAVVPWDGAR